MSGSAVRGSNSYVWSLSEILGQGATSVVYKGRNKKTGDEVAVKVFNMQSYHRPFNVQMREFEVMKKLSHENVVTLLDIEEELPNRAKVIVMEFCTHGSLYNLLDQAENQYGLSEEEFLNVLSQVTAGVKHLRDHNIIHRDIKPGNILRSMGSDGRSVFKLTDFGAARELQQDEEFLSLYGTDEYLHPDMYERAVLRRAKGQQFGVYVDLWSLGVTFYHAATGSLPFRPFGGRRNKETMHMITTKKEHGVISGVQDVQGGPIKYSRDLPLTCRLSRGMKALVTPFLADLLEKDPDKTINFDDFFTRVDDITSRFPYVVFCPSSFSQLIVYTRPRDDMSQLRQLITDQTEIPGGAQLLLLDGKVLRDESRDPVSQYLKFVTSDNPIFVFNKLPEYKRFIRPAYGEFMDIPHETSVITDYSLCKRNFSSLYSMKHAVKTLLHFSALMDKAVKMYSNYVNHKSLQLELSVGHLARACSDTNAWKEQLFSLLGSQTSVLKMLANSNLKPTHVDIVGRVNMLQTLHQTGNRECSQLNASIQSNIDKATNLLQNMKTGQAIDIEWDPSIGCLPSERCIEKMDVIIQKLQKIMSSFRDNRAKVQLTNNDEQIHRFDKNKMRELCVTAKTLVDDHCIRKAQMLFNAFKQCYSKAVQIHDAGERLEGIMAEIVHSQGRLVDKLKVSGKQCVSQSESCLQALGHVEDQVCTEVTNKGDNSNAGDALTTAVNGMTLSSRQEKLDTVLDSLQNTRMSLEEVRALLSENTSLMERFSSLQDSPPEDDKSWEYVP